jgi:hypothetical protein
MEIPSKRVTTMREKPWRAGGHTRALGRAARAAAANFGDTHIELLSAFGAPPLGWMNDGWLRIRV